jgi:hypothetical protein
MIEKIILLVAIISMICFVFAVTYSKSKERQNDRTRCENIGGEYFTVLGGGNCVVKPND